MASRSKSRKRKLAAVSPLTPAQRRALAGLKSAGLLGSVYLGGGGAVAHHLGHRVSRDLDFFSRDANLDLEHVRRRAIGELSAETVAQTEVTLALRIADASIYPYPILDRLSSGPEGVKVAGLRDLAAMKLAAIAKRGVRRDYWDLYAILTRTKLTLKSVCDDYLRKFGVSEADLYHVLRALTWFEDAEADRRLPRGLTAKQWRNIREWFETNAAQELLHRTIR
jgi:hypothetical protein